MEKVRDIRTTTAVDNEALYPSVELAYPIAVASYDVALRRADVVEGRIQTVLALAATVALALPIAIHSNLNDAKFTSIWFKAALATFVVVLIIGGITKAIGQLEVLDPKELYERCLHYSKWEFQKNVIAWAAEDFEKNIKKIHRKKIAASAMIGFFFLGDLFLLIWVFQAVP